VFRFLFPAYPYVYKNHFILFAAASKLVQEGIRDFEIMCTYDDQQNALIRKLRRRFSADLPIHFTGYLPTHLLEAWYRRVDALVFPSLCETWGLPLSEAAAHGLSILAADLPYARETLCGYPNVCWLPPMDAEAWAQAMKSMIQGNTLFANPVDRVKKEPAFELSWAQWFQLWRHELQPQVKHKG
jgi:glycosyltransferase involved in cell wall biosynthesis